MYLGRMRKIRVVSALIILLALFTSGCGGQHDYDVNKVTYVFNSGDQDGAELDVYSSDCTVIKYAIRPYSDSGVDLFKGEIPSDDQCDKEEYTISQDDWNSIVNAVNENRFMALPEELPEVEATDGSTRYIEVFTSEGDHRSGGYCAGNGSGKEHQRFSEVVSALQKATLN